MKNIQEKRTALSKSVAASKYSQVAIVVSKAFPDDLLSYVKLLVGRCNSSSVTAEYIQHICSIRNS